MSIPYYIFYLLALSMLLCANVDSISPAKSATDVDERARSLLGDLSSFERYVNAYTCANAADELTLSAEIDTFLSNFLSIFTDADFQPSPNIRLQFIAFNNFISNMFRFVGLFPNEQSSVVRAPLMTHTDEIIKRLNNVPGSYEKILTLYSPRNRININPMMFFEQTWQVWQPEYITAANMVCEYIDILLPTLFSFSNFSIFVCTSV